MDSIKEIKELKNQVENEISKLIFDFVEKTKLDVSSVSVNLYHIEPKFNSCPKSQDKLSKVKVSFSTSNPII